MRIRSLCASALIAGVLSAAPVAAQRSASALDSLVARAVEVSPAIHAAYARVSAARARVRPAFALPDPMLMLGIINQPLGSMTAAPATAGAMVADQGPDPMTMRMVGVSQMFPFPGKRSLQRRSAELEVDAGEASLDAARRQVTRDVKAAGYELAFVDQALSIIERNRDVLTGLIRITESRYGAGSVSQGDVLKARVEAARLAETAATLREQRLAMSAQLNALLDRPTDSELPHLEIPDGIARAAVASSSGAIRFATTAFGSRAADSPLRPLDELQDAAAHMNPELRMQDAMIAAQAARAELARKAHLPDVEFSLQYGQRGGGLPDMISATMSLPIPISKRTKQDQLVNEANAALAALEADRRGKVNAIRGDVARLVSEIERDRSSLALSVKAILPQSRAALMSATASYQVGKVELLTVLENQSTVFGYETGYFRALSNFATTVAELERMVGQEVFK